MKSVTTEENAPAAAPRQPEVERPYIAPDVNIFESETSYALEAEMPGVTKDTLEVILEGHSLTLVGRRTDEAPPGELLHRESKPADFRRVFELDPTIDTKKIRAQMNQGVLLLELPKAEAVKPRKITVD